MKPGQLEEIRARHAAATPGPYRWEARPESKSTDLMSVRSGGLVVMQLTRWGLQGAQARFRDMARCIMLDMTKLLTTFPGREHHEWAQRIDHPDAIALETSWEDREALLAEVDALQAKAPEWPMLRTEEATPADMEEVLVWVENPRRGKREWRAAMWYEPTDPKCRAYWMIAWHGITAKEDVEFWMHAPPAPPAPKGSANAIE